VLRVPKEANVGQDNRGNGPQSRNDLSGVVEPTHLRVAGGEIAIRHRKTWILLDRQKQLRRCLIEPSIEKMREAYYNKRRFDADARAEAQRGLGMLDPEIRLARPGPEDAAGEPALREIRVERERTVEVTPSSRRCPRRKRPAGGRQLSECLDRRRPLPGLASRNRCPSDDPPPDCRSGRPSPADNSRARPRRVRVRNADRAQLPAP
jgi:hypothetical protein